MTLGDLEWFVRVLKGSCVDLGGSWRDPGAVCVDLRVCWGDLGGSWAYLGGILKDLR